MPKTDYRKVGSFVLEEGIEVTIYKSHTFNAVVAWDYRVPKGVTVSDQRMNQIRSFGKKFIEDFNEIYNIKSGTQKK